MVILALDQSSSNSGFAVIKDGALIASGCINITAGWELLNRVVAMCDEIDKLIGQYKPEYLIIEEIYGLPGRYNALKALAIVRGGLILTWWRRTKAFPMILNCSQARAQLGINGRAKKPEVMAAVNAKFNLKITNEHQADAIVLAIVARDLLINASPINIVPPKTKILKANPRKTSILKTTKIRYKGRK